MQGLESFGADLASSAFDLAGSRHLQQRNTAFQREMAQNRFQYMSEDLKKAGLNPILAMKGGLSAGAVGSAPATSAGSLVKGTQRRLMDKQQEQIDKTIDKTDAEIDAINANTLLTKEKTKIAGLPANIADKAENLLDTTVNSAENYRRQVTKFKQPGQTGYIGKDVKGNKVIQHYKHPDHLRKKRKQTRRGLR